jgi:NADH:ubiquinone oxidoreductase subunit 6 (subunit J)
MDQSTLLFLILATFTGVSAVAVVVTQNIVRSAVYLLFTLAGTAGIFFLLGADFVGATQLIIYVGGILVLVVFGVMLTAQGPFVSMKVGGGEWAVASAVGILLMGALAVSVSMGNWATTPTERMDDAQSSLSSARLGEAFLGFPAITPREPLTGIPPANRPHYRQRVAYLLPFEIVSVHLLVVLIGAAYLARAKRRKRIRA